MLLELFPSQEELMCLVLNFGLIIIGGFVDAIEIHHFKAIADACWLVFRVLG